MVLIRIDQFVLGINAKILNFELFINNTFFLKWILVSERNKHFFSITERIGRVHFFGVKIKTHFINEDYVEEFKIWIQPL